MAFLVMIPTSTTFNFLNPIFTICYCVINSFFGIFILISVIVFLSVAKRNRVVTARKVESIRTMNSNKIIAVDVDNVSRTSDNQQERKMITQTRTSLDQRKPIQSRIDTDTNIRGTILSRKIDAQIASTTSPELFITKANNTQKANRLYDKSDQISSSTLTTVSPDPIDNSFRGKLQNNNESAQIQSKRRNERIGSKLLKRN
jgi:hypothetical protein